MVRHRVHVLYGGMPAMNEAVVFMLRLLRTRWLTRKKKYI